MKHVDPKTLSISRSFYKSAKDLGITEDERNRLIGVSKHLEDDASPFSMPTWDKCIKGHMYLKRNKKPESIPLHGLFGRTSYNVKCWEATGTKEPMYANRKHAVFAIDYFLLHGK
jgi:hypothetical protein